MLNTFNLTNCRIFLEREQVEFRQLGLHVSAYETQVWKSYVNFFVTLKVCSHSVVPVNHVSRTRQDCIFKVLDGKGHSDFFKAFL